MVKDTAVAQQAVRLFLDGNEIYSDVAPIIINGRTMVPIRAISEGIGLNVEWDGPNYRVLITNPAVSVSGTGGVTSVTIPGILGTSQASQTELLDLMIRNNPDAPRELPELYLRIGAEYGIRGDLAFCQAAKETGWWKFGGLVQPFQNNYCGLSATGAAATGSEDLRGADPTKVCFQEGIHGAIFDTPATGVEAHIQHLYAYASNKPLPAGKTLLDPRFILVSRGIAQVWSDLNGRWAVPGVGYGESIMSDYYAKAVKTDNNLSPAEQIQRLQVENQQLRTEIARLKSL